MTERGLTLKEYSVFSSSQTRREGSAPDRATISETSLANVGLSPPRSFLSVVAVDQLASPSGWRDDRLLSDGPEMSTKTSCTRCSRSWLPSPR